MYGSGSDDYMKYSAGPSICKAGIEIRLKLSVVLKNSKLFKKN
jgi:hypothetical protein